MLHSIKNISILGSTGSIGRNTIEVVKKFPDKFNVLGLSTNKNIELLEVQIKEVFPNFVVVNNYDKYKIFKNKHKNIEVLYGKEGLTKITTHKDIDIVVNALVGFSGFIPTLEALKSGKICAIANKETIVVGGDLLKRTFGNFTSNIIPIDSEHSAIFNLLKKFNRNYVEKLILTASGGPFRDIPVEHLENVTINQALNHPVWKMGNKITIDSSTMMNKGFEVIEAHHLFDFDFNNIETIIHKESTIHSMIETIDGELYAQLSVSDMKLPIMNALSYPDIFKNNFNRLNLSILRNLSFEPMDMEKFPLLKLAYDVGKIGHSLPAVLNASNEICVNEFIKENIKFLDIYRYVSKTVEFHDIIKNPDYDDIIETDRWARNYTEELIKHYN